MYSMVEKFYGDIGEMALLPLEAYFNAVRSIPYRKDPPGTETVARPSAILRMPAADCKKKSILIAAWCKANGIPYRLIACSALRNRRVHHVFPDARINGEYRPLDATYPSYRPFQVRPYTKLEVLSR